MWDMMLRTAVVFVFLSVLLRLMGKRQFGELTVPEFVSAILMSELAVLPVTNKEIPFFESLVPALVIFVLEITMSFMCRKSKALHAFLSGRPVVLMQNGRLLTENLKKARISEEELRAQIRSAGFKGEQEVDSVILECTGRMSVLPKHNSDGN